MEPQGVKELIEIKDSRMVVSNDERRGIVVRPNEDCSVFIEPEEKACRWIIERLPDYIVFKCSVCNERFDYLSDNWLICMNYCPNCGAKVVEKKISLVKGE